MVPVCDGCELVLLEPVYGCVPLVDPAPEVADPELELWAKTKGAAAKTTAMANTTALLHVLDMCVSPHHHTNYTYLPMSPVAPVVGDPVPDDLVVEDSAPGIVGFDPWLVSDWPAILPTRSVGDPGVPVPRLTAPGCSVILVPGLSTPIPDLSGANLVVPGPTPEAPVSDRPVISALGLSVGDSGVLSPISAPRLPEPDCPLVSVLEVCAKAKAAIAHSTIMASSTALPNLLDMCVFSSHNIPYSSIPTLYYASQEALLCRRSNSHATCASGVHVPLEVLRGSSWLPAFPKMAQVPVSF